MDYTSAYELLLQRPIDANIEFKYGFGDYLQLADGDTSSDMNERTRGCIALMPTGRADGGWYFLVLKTWKVIVRRSGFKLPMPDIVIEYINEKASASRLKRGLLDDRMRIGLWRANNQSYEIDDKLDENLTEEIEILNSELPNYIEPTIIDLDFNSQQIDYDHGEVPEPMLQRLDVENLSADIDGYPVDGARDLLLDIYEDIEIENEPIESNSNEYIDVDNSNDELVMDSRPGTFIDTLEDAIVDSAVEADSYRISDNSAATIEIDNELTEPRHYATRHGARAGTWDPRTHQRINVLRKSLGSRSKAFKNQKSITARKCKVMNMSIKYAIKHHGQEAVDSIVKEIFQLYDKDTFVG
jgi:hypothetical protein